MNLFYSNIISFINYTLKIVGLSKIKKSSKKTLGKCLSKEELRGYYLLQNVEVTEEDTIEFLEQIICK